MIYKNPVLKSKAELEKQYGLPLTDKQAELLNKHAEMVANDHPSARDSQTLFSGPRKHTGIFGQLYKPQGLKQKIAFYFSYLVAKIYMWLKR